MKQAVDATIRLSTKALLAGLLLIGTSCEDNSSARKIVEELEVDESRLHQLLPQDVAHNQEEIDRDYKDSLAKLPMDRQDPQAKQLFPDVVEHPWMKQQPYVSKLDRTIVSDIRMTRHAAEQLQSTRGNSNTDEEGVKEEAEEMIRAMNNLQLRLSPLAFDFPESYYNVLNIPATPQDQYGSPLPFEIYKRLLVDHGSRGEPIYFDVRVFELDPSASKASQDRQVMEVVNWHLDVLRGGVESFQRFASDDVFVFVGRGDHNTQHLDSIKGNEGRNRGVFVAFIQRDNLLYTLYLDAPWSSFERHRQVLMHIVNRPLVEYGS